MAAGPADGEHCLGRLPADLKTPGGIHHGQAGRTLHAGDICRCAGDLTLALRDEHGAIIGSATVHPGRISWERQTFRNDILGRNDGALRLMLARAGVPGSSRALLDDLLTALDRREGAVQFRPAGDAAALRSHRVPPALWAVSGNLSGEQAAGVDDELVDRWTERLVDVLGDTRKAVRQVFEWVGSATWPAEAVAGDGQLARRMLERFSMSDVAAELPLLSEPRQLMGAVAWAAFQQDDASVMGAVGPALTGLLARSRMAGTWTPRTAGADSMG